MHEYCPIFGKESVGESATLDKEPLIESFNFLFQTFSYNSMAQLTVSSSEMSLVTQS